jgi:hypothetical protein
MTTRRALLALLLTLAIAPALAVEDQDCGCGPKSKPANRAEHFYQMALAADDPDQKRRLAETALRILPDHAGALALLEQLATQ